MYTANYDDLNGTIHAGADPGFFRGGGGAKSEIMRGKYWYVMVTMQQLRNEQ